MTQEKTCTTCGETKGVDGFDQEKKGKFGVRSACKVCRAEYNKKYNQENKESVAEYHKKYQQENKESKAEYYKKYYQKNKESKAEYHRKYNRENKESKAEYHRKYQQENKPLYRAIQAKRRSRKLNATPPWLTEEHYEEIKAIYLKAQTLTEETGIPHHVDHQVPLQGKKVCGLHVPWNLDPLPASDNMKKNNTFDGGW